LVDRPNSEYPISAKIWLFVSPVCPSRHCRTHTKTTPQPCPPAKPESSFASELGPTRPETGGPHAPPDPRPGPLSFSFFLTPHSPQRPRATAIEAASHRPRGRRTRRCRGARDRSPTSASRRRTAAETGTRPPHRPPQFSVLAEVREEASPAGGGSSSRRRQRRSPRRRSQGPDCFCVFFPGTRLLLYFLYRDLIAFLFYRAGLNSYNLPNNILVELSSAHTSYQT
jgi:hypothetical protein